ncbi:MAG: phospho-N-acetylmuramoyl-pentapeptide-transferase, partial [Ruminococcaceae bacterium]|nr:phospho-N-acetylmuramoyl-pentapeptide-transferase [Oscillospiraceae bacterium]
MEKLSLLGFLVAFWVTVITGPFIIRWLISLKFGQSILEIGPNWHKNKQGTPTMGGIMFILGILIAAVIFVRDSMGWIALGTALCFGAIGFYDDYIKVAKKRNLGLTSKQKFLLQLIIAIALTVGAIWKNGTTILIPFTAKELDLGWFYVPFILFVILGTENSVNLTDGIDGLAASITVIVMLFISGMAWQYTQDGLMKLAIMAVAGCLGFLVYNHHPAKVFMGDTGSLFLGGLVSATAVLLRQPLLLLLIGFVYFMETLSVILQVASFKLTKKRIFKMSPIHHHFEMCG